MCVRKRKSKLYSLSSVKKKAKKCRWLYIVVFILIIQTATGTLFAEDLTKSSYDPSQYYPNVSPGKVKSMKDRRPRNRVSSKNNDSLDLRIPYSPRYSTAPIYYPQNPRQGRTRFKTKEESDPIDVEVPKQKVNEPLNIKVPYSIKYSTTTPLYYPEKLRQDRTRFNLDEKLNPIDAEVPQNNVNDSLNVKVRSNLKYSTTPVYYPQRPREGRTRFKPEEELNPIEIEVPKNKVNDSLNIKVPYNLNYSTTPIYKRKKPRQGRARFKSQNELDPLHVEVPTGPRYPSPPTYHPTTTPVYHPNTKFRSNNEYDEGEVNDGYYGLLRSRNHFTYSSPECLGNNYYNTTHGLNWCDHDAKYPSIQIESAIQFHFFSVASMYKDVYEEESPREQEKADGDEMNIDNGLKEPLAHQKIIRKRKTFEQREDDDSNEPRRRCKKSRSLCSTLGEEVIRPRRAKNTNGEWRIIVNDVTAQNRAGERFYLTQTARIERCSESGNPCPIIPDEYPSLCIQKYNVHRMMVFDPFQYYLPFAVETFILPSSCNCVAGDWSPEIAEEENAQCKV